MDGCLIIITLVGFIFSSSAEGCLLPLSDGTWVSSTRGTWTVSSNATVTTVDNFKADLTRTKTTATVQCKSSNGTQYIIGTTFELFFQSFIDVFMCIDIQTTSASPSSYVYHIVTPTDPNTGEKFTGSEADACTNTNYDYAINTHVLLSSGSETTAAVDCPDAILGNYSVTYEDKDGSTATEGSDMDSCSNTTQLVFNNADSAKKLAFTSGNLLHCLHSVTSDSTVYLHTYNSDASVDDTSTYSIACWVIVDSESQVAATVHPNECVQSQSSTAVPYGGQKFTFSPFYTCALNQAAVDSSLSGWLIALIVLGVLTSIFIIVIIVLCVMYVRKGRHVRDEEEGIIKDKRHPSPDSLRDDDVGREKSRLRRNEEGYDSGFDEKGIVKEVYKPRDKTIKEHTFDLVEVTRSSKQKLKEGPVNKDLTVAKERLPHLEPIEFPPGKKPIPPTTPRPDNGDTALLRIKKERERKEKERQEKKRKEKEVKEERKKLEVKEPEENVDQVIKHVRKSSSSDEYETDDSEKEERALKLMQKRKRLAAAAYQPPDGGPDATVVGRKKRKQLREGENMTKSLTTREQQEVLDTKRRHRKKALKRMAKSKFRPTPSDVETSDSETDIDSTMLRHKRRKAGDKSGISAPYIEQYHVKKDIEKELDDMDYWQEKIPPIVMSEEKEMDEDGKIRKRVMQVAPADTTKEGADEGFSTQLEKIMEEEADVWAAYGLKGFKLGRGGEPPEGFHFDEEGNIVRDIDGKVIPKDAFEKQMDTRRRFGFVFSLPRLIRNSDGRPLGGYKDDDFGPTAEWDYGDIQSNNDDEDELKKLDSQRPVSGKQVAFSVEDDQDAQNTPTKELDYSQIKGRHLGSAERVLLKQRLFEGKVIPDAEPESKLPVYFVGAKGGVKPGSIYIENSQIERQEPDKFQRSMSTRTAPYMVVRSDTFNDGRGGNMHRHSKMRSSWSGNRTAVPQLIPEEAETASQQDVQGHSYGKRNLGSDDEFILVGGSMTKINRPPHSTDFHLASHWCSRYERHGHLPTLEQSELSDMTMRTAPDSRRPFSGDDKRLKKLLQELYTDKKYFDHYLDAENLPTNAAVETRGLASHGIDFLKDRAEYWQEHQPVVPVPPPSELALRMSRMRTFNADSGRASMSSNTDRPYSADDVQRTDRNNSVIIPSLPSNRTGETAGQSVKESYNTERKPPTGRSEAPSSPSKLEPGKKEKSVTIDTTPREIEKTKGEEMKNSQKVKPNANNSSEYMLPGNVLSLTDS